MNFFRDQSGQVGIAALLFLVLAGIIAGGVYMLDSIGLIDFKKQLYSNLESIPVVGEYVSPSPVSKQQYALDRLRKKEKELEDLESELEQRKESLDRQSNSLEEKREEMQRQETELSKREKALMERRRRFESREERIKYLADLYGSMRPADAAQRLEAIEEDRVVIGILQQMDNRGASVLLSRMGEERAAAISRKMAQYPPRIN